uniref:Poly [ADP-ribose] polymerase n=1 Tax=Capitella teleta TaxID=283909 RepID=X1Z9Z7_CAPTE
MKENETETECLLSYINKSMDIARSCKVTGIFRVERPGEDDRLRDCGVDNRRLLFHGSSTSNLMSILKRGLLIAPPEAPACGYLFGKGIYTADQFAKSAAYCYNWGFGSGNSKHKFMLVCEVALGRVNQLLQPEYMEKAKTGTDSCQYVGARGPNPAFNLTLPTGVAVPIGEIQDQGKLFSRTYLNAQSNEYIVYKPEQVALRYIIQFK